jgi:hypothetical protein
VNCTVGHDEGFIPARQDFLVPRGGRGRRRLPVIGSAGLRGGSPKILDIRQRLELAPVDRLNYELDQYFPGQVAAGRLAGGLAPVRNRPVSVLLIGLGLAATHTHLRWSAGEAEL